MNIWTEINWSEGMFLRPHHLQLLHRHWETIGTSQWSALVPYAWGFSQLEISAEAVSNNTFTIDRCVLRLPGGSCIRVPENTQADPRDFRAQLEKSAGTLDVHFGVPVIQRVRPNTYPVGFKPDEHARRYLAEILEFYDENTGQNPQPIEIRRMRGAFFFGEEDRTGYETIQVAAVERSPGTGAAPRLVEKRIPPLMGVQVWLPLHNTVKNVLAEVQAKADVLARVATERRMSFSTGALADVEHLFKLHLLNETGEFLGGILIAPMLHPYSAYVHLRSLLGRLSLFQDSRRPPAVPAYDHENCGPPMYKLIEDIKNLLHAIVPSDFEFEPFVRQLGGLSVTLQPDWVYEERSMFIGFDTDLDLDQLRQHISKVNMKIASPSLAPMLHTRGLPGLSFKDAHVKPGELPHPPGRYYFQIKKDNEYWPRVIQEKAIALRVPEQKDLDSLEKMKLTLYVVKPRR